MLGLVQRQMLLLSIERRSRRLARALKGLGVRLGDRVATLAWNGYRHFELYYGLSGMGAVCHTVNPRLAPDDIAYVTEHAGDGVIFADPDFADLLAAIAPALRGTVRAVVRRLQRAAQEQCGARPRGANAPAPQASPRRLRHRH